MMTKWMKWIPAALVATACGSPTDTGNPDVNANNGNPNLGEGIDFHRSALKRNTNPNVSEQELATLRDGNRDFAFDFYAQYSGDGNRFFSPFSISTAFGMLYAGAKGTSYSELKQVFHFDLEDAALHQALNATALAIASRETDFGHLDVTEGKGFRFDVTNGAFGQAGFPFQPAYLDILAENYGAGMFSVDFMSAPEQQRLLINDWISEQTEDRIPELLPQGSISPGTALVLANTTYFKAAWQSEFDPANTQQETFTTPTGSVTAAMMNGSMDSYYRGADFAALSVPYISPDVSMIFLLPDEGAFDTVESAMGRALLEEVTAGLGWYWVNTKIPKFEFSATTPLKDQLMGLGLQSVFSGSADLSGIGGAPGQLFVSDAFHQAFVSIDEEGTEAAAATAIAVRAVSAPPPAEFHATRPFLFLVHDKPSGHILFMGRVTDPTQN